MNSERKIVCIVDDDKIYQFTSKKIISNVDIPLDIIIFSDGEEALNYLKANLHSFQLLPDYIFLDINMPFKDGWQFLDEYHLLKNKLAKPNKIFIVSSSIDEEDLERAAENHLLSGYIAKPLTKEKFLKATHLDQS